MTTGKAKADAPGSVRHLQSEAMSLVSRLPELMVEARHVASTVAYGVHGRRRVGPGETFWQFRQMQPGDARQQIDWRRSAASDRLYIREKEWEAAHTVWLWADLSPSMLFASSPRVAMKRDRAVVLMLAAAELLCEGGERVAVIDLMPPSSRRGIARAIAERLASLETSKAQPSLPQGRRLPRFSEVILFSDFLEPAERLRAAVGGLSQGGIRGHLLEVSDPAEETLPYEGRVLFEGMEAEEGMLASRVEGLRHAYQQRLAAHRAETSLIAGRHGWSHLTHRTDRPAVQALLALHTQVGRSATHYRHGNRSAAAMKGPALAPIGPEELP